MLSNIAILAADTCRSRIYLQHLGRHNLLPSFALLLLGASDQHLLPGLDKEILQRENRNSYDLGISVSQLLENLGIPHRKIECGDPNDSKCTEILKTLDHDFVIYSGPGGKILRKETLNIGKKFLHVHPGILPKYKGSTTIYYSLLCNGTCGSSAFIMDEKIDNGPVLLQKEFPPPVDRRNIDLFYDSYIRAELLAEAVQLLEKSSTEALPQNQNSQQQTYFVIHPILKSIAIYGNIK